MKKYLKILLIFVLLGIYVYSKFVYLDPDYNCSIKVIPNFMPSNFDTKKIIKIVKSGSEEEYKKLCQYVNTINKNPSCGGFDGGCYELERPGTIYIGNDQGNIALAAALLVHETCHAIQAYENRTLGESECYTAGNNFLQEITIY